MTDERRWTIYVCPGCGTVTDYDRSTGCGACEDGPMTVPVVVVPVSSVVPIARLREWIEAAERLLDKDESRDGLTLPVCVRRSVLRDLTALLSEYEGTTDGD